MLLDTFVKTYADRTYVHVTSLRHKGSLIAFAMDRTRRIYYSVLSFDGGADLGPLDVNYWSETPAELIFPMEIAQVGIGVADQTALPTYKKGAAEPVAAGAEVRADELDAFRSTTARLSADAPFQALSDGRYVYLFRQAVAAGDAGNVRVLDAKGKPVKGADGGDAWVVDGTLLMDRFVLSGARLQPKMEVRFQRSRSRARPQSRKDSLGARDMQDAPFFEPTQELGFIRNLDAGRFAALLLPTQVAGVMRWQIFAENKRSGMVDSYNVERSADGLFNTRGSLAATVGGSAESAMRLGPGRELRLVRPLEVAGAFSIEAWIRPDAAAQDGWQVLVDGVQDGLGGAVDSAGAAGLQVALNPQTREVRVSTRGGDTYKPAGTHRILTPGAWSCLAVGYDGKDLGVYLDGALRWKMPAAGLGGFISRIGAADGGFQGTIDELRVWGRARSERQIAADMSQRLVGHEPGLIGYWRFDEARGGAVYDQTDSVCHAACHQADAASGDAADTAVDGDWVTSDAPIGETGGVRRDSFRVAGRTVASGMSALFYYHQEDVAGGYGDSAPIKQAARVLLAFGAAGDDGKAKVAAVDFGVFPDGRLAQIPDTVELELLEEQVLAMPAGDPPAPEDAALGGAPILGAGPEGAPAPRGVWLPKSAVGRPAAASPDLLGVADPSEAAPAPAATAMTVSQALEYVSGLEQQNKVLSSDIAELTQIIDWCSGAIATIDAAVAEPSTYGVLGPLGEFDEERLADLNKLIANLESARKKLASAVAARRGLEAALDSARVVVYEHINFGGRRLELGLGDWGYSYFSERGFNDLISSLSVPAQLKATLYEHAGMKGKSREVVATTSWVGDDWNDITSYIRVATSAAFAGEYTKAQGAEAAALAEVAGYVKDLGKQRAAIDGLRSTKAVERTKKDVERAAIRAELARVRGFLNNGSAVPMGLLHIDPRGLSVAGGLLDFAWTTDTPLLFDSATGSLALYFRGSDDQFFVTYYQTRTQRARLPLLGADGSAAATGVARSSELRLDTLTVAVADGAGDDTCTVTIALGAIVETWRRVPRDPARFARVINGEASERSFVGLGSPANSDSGVVSLAIPAGLRRDLAEGDMLLVGRARLKVAAATAHGATTVPVLPTVLSLPEGEQQIYYVEYDYLGDAATTSVPANLVAGSQLLVVQAEAGRAQGAGQAVANAASVSAATVSCQWTASAPGHTLSFDGKASVARSTAADLGSFAAPRDLTIEAWVRPGHLKDEGQIARVVQHRSGGSGYGLGLRRETIRGALHFGAEDIVSTEAHPALALDGPITIEAWVRPDDSVVDGDIFSLSVGGSLSGSVLLRIADGGYSVGGYGSTANAVNMAHSAAFVGEPSWAHVAGVYEPQGGKWLLYINGDLAATSPGDAAPSLNAPATARIGSGGDRLALGAPLTLGDRPLASAERGFRGAIDEVRLWRRARSQAEIRGDKDRRLAGNETDLVANWRFEDGVARDSGRHGIAATMGGFARREQIASPVPAYSFYAQAGGATLRASQPFFGGSWTHLAASYQQSYALAFGGGHLDCGNDTTLDISGDLTIEVFFSYADTGQAQGLISRGLMDDGGAQDVPYALYIGADGRPVFAFEDVEHVNRTFVSDDALGAGDFHRLTVTRERQVVREDIKDSSGNLIDVKVTSTYAIRMYAGKDEILAASYSGADPGSSDGPVVLGRAAIDGGAVRALTGTISEARVWNIAREAKSVGSDIRGSERGLVAWWRLEENQGTIAYDAKGKNHGRLRGGVVWVKNPEPGGSRLALYRDGVAQHSAADLSLTPPASDQFSVGALSTDSATVAEAFAGELEELRIWQVARTQEQIQDNLFCRLMGEREDLIAYYPFDTEEKGVLLDAGNRDNRLAVSGADYVLSTAPIGTDTPQARSALAGLRTSFNGRIAGRPAVAEYGDVQYDAEGEMTGVLKRSYALVEDGRWKLIAGFKVGNLVAEWVGQVQFDPQLIGYIEGAPPVPGENLTAQGGYAGSSSVEIVAADRSTYTYSSTRDSGFDMSVDATLGLGAKSLTLSGVIAAPLGVGTAILSSVEETDISGEIKASFENSLGWLEEASTSSSVVTNSTTRMELRGAARDGRFVADNTGLALVQSETADVFALRLKHNRALVSFQMRPNPDIPKDWNIIPFRMNRAYTKQGTLDGRLGLGPDADFPNALGYSSDRSFFKPIEAYALKNRIRREEEDLKALFDQYDAGAKGRRQADTHFSAGDLGAGRSLAKLPRRFKRNLVNTYVWTADGGLFAETEETMDVLQETVGGSYAFTGMAGGTLSIDFAGMKVLSKFELTAMFGGHLNLTVQKSAEAERSFRLGVDIGALESDIYQRNPDGSLALEADPAGGVRPLREPGKVDAYRFMSFYLEPRSDHFDTFFGQVVDPIWLEQSDEPNAQALRQARGFTQDGRKPACWRVMHRVTFVSRVLPRFEAAASTALERTMRELDIDSNYELIRLLDPFVGDKTTSYEAFVLAVGDALAARAPELIPHKPQIIEYLALYYDIPESASLAAADDSLAGQSPASARLRVDAGPDLIARLNDAATLRGAIVEGSAKPEDLYVTWTMIEGPSAPIFSDAYALTTGVGFTQHGRYVLRLSASDGLVTSADDIALLVYGPPQISAGDAIVVGPDDSVVLRGAMRSSGVPQEAPADVKVLWEKVGGPGDAHFQARDGLVSGVSLTASGTYLLRLTVDNGHYSVSDDVTVAVAARVSDSLLALYSFGAAGGAVIHDVSGRSQPLHLAISDVAAVKWLVEPSFVGPDDRRVPEEPLGLDIVKGVTIASAGPARDLAAAARASGAFSLEIWVSPSPQASPGLSRMVSLSGGAGERNLVLGQLGGHIYAAVRTDATSPSGGDQALVAGSLPAGTLSQVVLVREAGALRLYHNGAEVGWRPSAGALAAWSDRYPLMIAGEPGAPGGWLGSFHLMAIYGRALSAAEVRQNYRFGADTNLPPVVYAGGALEVDLTDELVLAGSMVSLPGRVMDDRPLDVVKASWSQVSGPTTVEFTSVSAPGTQVKVAQPGDYVLRLSASDGALTSSDDLHLSVYQKPMARAEADSDVVLPAGATLRAKVDSSGWGAAGSPPITFSWAQTAGPAQAIIAAPAAQETAVRFTAPGAYSFAVTVGNGRPALAVRLEASVTAHAAPTIAIDAPSLVTMPARASLLGRVLALGRGDSGAPSPQITWRVLGEPAGARIAAPDSLATEATFTASGAYELELGVSNGHATATQRVRVVANAAPAVDAGPDQTVLLAEGLSLDGAAGDDGLPASPGALSLSWSQVSGRPGVSFADATSGATTARLPDAGRYTLRLTASDGAASSFDDVEVRALAPARLRAPRGLFTVAKDSPAALAVALDSAGGAEAGEASVVWSTASGPGALSFSSHDDIVVDGGLLTVSATAPQPGTYVARVTVTHHGLAASLDLTILVDRRVHAGLLAYYPFAGGSGATVREAAGAIAGAPLDLQISGAQRAGWAPDGYRIEADGRAVIATAELAENPIVKRISAAGSFTLELWVTPDNVDRDTQKGARLVTISADASSRNVTLQQGEASDVAPSFYMARVRTSAASEEKNQPKVQSARDAAGAQRQHIVYTFTKAAGAAAGTATLYVDGKPASATAAGDLSTWVKGYRLAVANEPGGDRPWRGTIHMLAIYERALAASEVAANRDAGLAVEPVSAQGAA